MSICRAEHLLVSGHVLSIQVSWIFFCRKWLHLKQKRNDISYEIIWAWAKPGYHQNWEWNGLDMTWHDQDLWLDRFCHTCRHLPGKYRLRDSVLSSLTIRRRSLDSLWRGTWHSGEMLELLYRKSSPWQDAFEEDSANIMMSLSMWLGGAWPCGLPASLAMTIIQDHPGSQTAQKLRLRHSPGLRLRLMLLQPEATVVDFSDVWWRVTGRLQLDAINYSSCEAEAWYRHTN